LVRERAQRIATTYFETAGASDDSKLIGTIDEDGRDARLKIPAAAVG